MTDDYGQEIWQNDTDAAQAEAVRRIHVAAETGATRLDLRDLTAMEVLPVEIKMLPALKELWCGQDAYEGTPNLTNFGHRLRDISALSQLENLSHAGFSRTRVSDLSTLAPSQRLTYLGLREVNVADWSVIWGLTSLQHLDLYQCGIPDLSPIGRLRELRHLYISRGFGAEVSRSAEESAALSKLTRMQNLVVSRIFLPDWHFLSEMADLRYLHANGSSFSSLQPLTNATRLEQLWCRQTPLASLDGLDRHQHLASLNIDETEVSDLTPLLDVETFATEKAKYLVYTNTPAADPANDRRLNLLSLLEGERCAIETIQYLNGTHPDFRDPPRPPAVQVTTNSLAHSGDIGLSVTDGKLSAANAGQPEKVAPQQLTQRVEALRIHLATLQDMARNKQVSPNILGLFDSYSKALDTEPPTYVMLDGPMAFLRGGVSDSYITEALDGMIVGAWQQLVMFHDELRPFLLPPEDDDLPDLSDDATPDAGLDVADAAIAALKDDSVDETLIDALMAVKDYFEVAKQDEAARPSVLRKGFRNVAGVVGQIMVGGAGGALGGWILTPNAANVVLRLQPVWEKLMRFFGA